ncbi:UNVERIFIED_CONTAM: hypothetical protein RF648_18165 [Kocuria sp. CPCC 205274]
MNLILGKNQDPENQVGKTMVQIQAIPSLKLKRDIDFDNPVIDLTWQADIEQANYATIDYVVNGVNRIFYYFVDEIEVVNPKILRFRLRLDVLETYKSVILSSEGTITFSELESYTTQTTTQETRLEVETFESALTFPKGNSLVFHTVGRDNTKPIIPEFDWDSY